jgi:hypothetical protein
VYRLVYEAQYWHHRPRSFRLICLSKGKMRADERTRTADLISLRVRGQWLLGVAQDCNPRIDNGSFVPYIAYLLQGIACGLGSRVRGLRRGWFLFKPHSRASVCAATACSERPRYSNGRTVTIAPRHRRFIQDAGCRFTWGPSSPRKRPLPELLPGSPQPLSVLPDVAVAARPPTRQDRPRFVHAQKCQPPLFSEKYP